MPEVLLKISNRSPSLFVDVKQFRSNAFRVQFGLTLLNANFFQDCEFVHELLLLSPCDLHDDWIQPLVGDVVTDILVIFSSSPKKKIFMRSHLVSDSPNKFCPIGFSVK